MQLYLAAAPCCLGDAARWGLPLLHAAYGVEESRLTSLTLPAHVQGGLLLLTGPETPVVPQPDALARDILRECLRRRYTGVVIEPQLPAAALSALAELCRRYGRALYVAEPCGHMVPDARVVVSTALSGGTLRQRLGDACRRFGARRLALDLACVRMDFSLPAPYGTGTALTPQQLAELRGRRTVFFSPELCAHYFTYEQSGMTHFVLFDDADTLHRKIALGAELDIPAGFLALPEAMEALPRLLGKG